MKYLTFSTGILTIVTAFTSTAAQDSSNTQTTTGQTTTDSQPTSPTGKTISLYPPYPIPLNSSDPSAAISVHNSRTYLASILTVTASHTTIYAITCLPASQCATDIVGSETITVTQDRTAWDFSARVRVNGTISTMGVECQGLTRESKRCTFEGVDGSKVTAGQRGEESAALGPEDLRYFTTMSEVDVVVTAGEKRLDKSGGLRPFPTTESASSTGKAPRVTGAVGREVVVGALGVVGVAVFGL